ncbi:MAG: NAD(+) diphosphatase [Acidimicrobiales bacterium]
MPFVPLTVPPEASGAAPSRWYAVRGAELLVVGAGEGAEPVGRTTPGLPALPGDLAAASDTDAVFLGLADGDPCWALGVSAEAPAPPGARWVSLLALGAELDADDWSVAGRAVQLVEWCRTSRYCGRCGTPTMPLAGERAMRCPACGLSAYPRLAPAVIVLVHRDGQVLLARNARFRGRMFSTLAGFVEPGETLEEAVHREVGEEVGVRLRRVTYFGSQPWPFPHSLMVGFVAEWADGEIVVDGEEIAEAAWWEPAALPEIPPPASIARRMIDAWLAAGAGGAR